VLVWCASGVGELVLCGDSEDLGWGWGGGEGGEVEWKVGGCGVRGGPTYGGGGGSGSGGAVGGGGSVAGGG